MHRTVLAIALVVAFLAATPSLHAQDNWASRALVERTVNCLNQVGPCDRAVQDFLAKFAGKPGRDGRPGRDGNTPSGPEIAAIIIALAQRGELPLPPGRIDEAALREIVSRLVAEELKKLQPQQPAPTATPGTTGVVPPVPAPSREISLPDWVWWALLLAALAALIWWLTRHRVRNDGRFYVGRYRFARRRAEAVLSRGPALAADKRVVNLTRTAPAERRWAPRVAAGFGDLLQFRLEWRNDGYTAVPAALVRMQDALEGPGVREGAVLLTVGDNGQDIILAEAQANALFGAGLALADVPNAPAELAPRTSIYLRYQVRVDLPGNGEGAGPAPAQN